MASVVPKEVLADLPAFVAVAERLSFRAAAEALGLTPAALSKAINRLEDRVGEPLLSRTTRRVELTPAGVVFRGRAVEALQLIADGLAAAALGRRLAGPVRVAAPSLVLPLLGARMADLSLRHPGLVLALSPLDTGAPADLTILIGPRAAQSQAEAEVALGSVPLVTVAAPAYVARHGAAMLGREAAGMHRWLRHDPGVCGMDGRARKVDWSGVDPAGTDLSRLDLPGGRGPGARDAPAAVLTSSDPQSLVGAAIGGAGVLTTLRPLVAQHLASGRLVAVAIGDDPAPLAIRACLSAADGAMPRVVLALASVAQALGLPAPDAGQFSGVGKASGVRASDVAAPRSSPSA